MIIVLIMVLLMDNSDAQCAVCQSDGEFLSYVAGTYVCICPMIYVMRYLSIAMHVHK